METEAEITDVEQKALACPGCGATKGLQYLQTVVRRIPIREDGTLYFGIEALNSDPEEDEVICRCGVSFSPTDALRAASRP